jgi:hypothetical protein
MAARDETMNCVMELASVMLAHCSLRRRPMRMPMPSVPRRRLLG